MSRRCMPGGLRLGAAGLVLFGCVEQGVHATMQSSIDGASVIAFEGIDAAKASLASWAERSGETLPAASLEAQAGTRHEELVEAAVHASVSDEGAKADGVGSPRSIGPIVSEFIAMAHAEASSRAPHVDCTPIDTQGYRGGRRIPLSLITIDGLLVERNTASAFWAMREAALTEGVDLRIYSGFRTREEQAELYDCYRCRCCNGGTKAAPPGYSNHQSGRALDLLLRAPEVHPWLVAHAHSFGFHATVPNEPWHWEFHGRRRPDLCKALAVAEASSDASRTNDISTAGVMSPRRASDASRTDHTVTEP